MKNFIQPGKTVTLPAPGAVKSGDGVHVDHLFGVAAYDAVQGADVEVALEGVFELPKAAGVVSPGELIYWSGTNCATDVVSGHVLIGAAVAAAGSGATTVRVRLNGTTVP
jgi:predicted RecA/RadA family phage recombinase